MKKAITLILVLIMSLSLVACTTKESKSEKSDKTNSEEKASGSTEEKQETEKETEEQKESAINEDSEESSDPVGDKVIRVATPGNYRPFTIYDEKTEEWSGFELDLWEAIGKKTGYKIEYVRIDLPGAFGEVDLGNADTVAKQISITPVRQEKYDFTRPFFFSPYTLTVQETNDEIKSWKDMEGKSIALAEGSAMNEFIDKLDPDNKVKKAIYESGGAILQEVNLGRADAVPYAYLVLPYFLEKNPELKLKSVDIENPIYVEVNGYPFPRTERGKALREVVDKALADLIEDGTHREICEKWFKIDIMESKFAKEYFAEHK